MKSRLLAGIAAVVLALTGALMVFSYASGAEARAVQKLEPQEVLVVQQAVPAGTAVSDLAASVSLDALPAASVAPSALNTLENSPNAVTAVDLVPGEQLLAERLVDPSALEDGGTVEVPEGFHEISVIVEPQRIAGGRVAAGDLVGVFMSLPEGGMEERPDAESSQLVLPNALVTAVQRPPSATTPAEDVSEDAAAALEAETLPEGSVLVTLALDADAATRIVFASEFGTIWLSKATVADPAAPPVIIQDKELYR